MQGFFTAQHETQEPVKTDEVIHVGMADEYMADAQQFARGPCPDVAEVEEQGALFELAVYEQRDIAGRAVDQLRTENGMHAVSRPICLTVQDKSFFRGLLVVRIRPAGCQYLHHFLVAHLGEGLVKLSHSRE